MSSFDMEAVTRQAEGEWAADASVRAEFGTRETFLAFRRAEARGGASRFGAADKATVAKPPAARATDAEGAWAGDAALRAEFANDKAAYLAFARADAAGLARIAGRQSAAPARHVESDAPAASSDLAQRQALARKENIGRQFAGLSLLDIPQQ